MKMIRYYRPVMKACERIPFFQFKVCKRGTFSIKTVCKRVGGWTLGQSLPIELCRVAPPPTPWVLRRAVRVPTHPDHALYTLVSLFDDAQPLLITIFQKFALSFYVWVNAHQHSSCPSYRKWEPAKKWLRTFKGYSRRRLQYTFHGLLKALNFDFQVQRLSRCLQTLKAR